MLWQSVEAFDAEFDQSPSTMTAEIPVTHCVFSDDGVPKCGTEQAPEKPEKQSVPPDRVEIISPLYFSQRLHGSGLT